MGSDAGGEDRRHRVITTKNTVTQTVGHLYEISHRFEVSYYRSLFNFGRQPSDSFIFAELSLKSEARA
jgi:hypothetical protein